MTIAEDSKLMRLIKKFNAIYEPYIPPTDKYIKKENAKIKNMNAKQFQDYLKDKDKHPFRSLVEEFDY